MCHELYSSRMSSEDVGNNSFCNSIEATQDYIETLILACVCIVCNVFDATVKQETTCLLPVLPALAVATDRTNKTADHS